MSADAVHQTISKRFKQRKIQDFEDYVKATEASGTKTMQMRPQVNMVEVEDGISRQRLAALSSDEQRPYLADLKALRVRRGSEDLMMKTDLKGTTWMAYKLTKSTFSAEEPLPMRSKISGIEKAKIKAICETLVPHLEQHKRAFWETMAAGTSAPAGTTFATTTQSRKRRRTR